MPPFASAVLDRRQLQTGVPGAWSLIVRCFDSPGQDQAGRTAIMEAAK
jgi:hypothetical protein